MPPGFEDRFESTAVEMQSEPILEMIDDASPAIARLGRGLEAIGLHLSVSNGNKAGLGFEPEDSKACGR